jgi:transcriptional regulator with XRE-family HTH domain
MNSGKLKQLREERGLLQKQIAIELGISREAYCHYEKGNREPDPQRLKQIADFFNVSVDYLLDVKPPSRDEIIDIRGLSEEAKQIMLTQMSMVEKLDEAHRKGETAKEFIPKSVQP